MWTQATQTWPACVGSSKVPLSQGTFGLVDNDCVPVTLFKVKDLIALAESQFRWPVTVSTGILPWGFGPGSGLVIREIFVGVLWEGCLWLFETWCEGSARGLSALQECPVAPQ